MLGFQEILIIVLTVLAIIFFRPLFSKKPPAQRMIRPTIKLSAKWRMALVASVVYPAAVAAYVHPWRNDPVNFYYIGIGPVVLGWLVCWVVMGFRKRS